MFLFDVPAGWLAVVNPHWIPINLGLLAALAAFGFLTYRRGVFGVVGLALTLPLYVARARIGWLPTTYLELVLIVVVSSWLVSLIGHQRRLPHGHDPLSGPILALLGAGTLALVWSPDLRAAAGLWKAYLVEPILAYWFARQVVRTERDRRWVIAALGLTAAVVAGIALWQWFSAVGIAEPGWVRLDRRRVTGWYTSPNAVGLYLGPLLVLIAVWALTAPRRIHHRILVGVVTGLGLTAIAATRSLGTWLGLAAALLVFCAWWLGRWRTLLMCTLAVAAVLALPAPRQWVARELSERAAQNRWTLWHGTVRYLTSSPQRFFQGAGIAGFARVQETFRDPRQHEPLIYPHTVGLNFWVEYGLLGLAAVGWLTWRVGRLAAVGSTSGADGIGLGALAALSTMLAHGLVDVPYFKNDLALLTWLLLVLAVPKPTATAPTLTDAPRETQTSERPGRPSLSEVPEM